MKKNNFPEEDVEKLIRSLNQDGWFSSSLLPENWWYKRNEKNIAYSNEEGYYIKSKEAAVQILSKEPEKNMHEISLLKQFSPPARTQQPDADFQPPQLPIENSWITSPPVHQNEERKKIVNLDDWE